MTSTTRATGTKPRGPRGRASKIARVAVVAPFGTGRYLPAELRVQGAEAVIAVVPPDASLPPLYRDALDRSAFDSVVTHVATDLTADQLRAAGVTAVVAGTELGVTDADRIAHALDLPGNDPSTSAARRDKGAMAAAVTAAGLSAPRSLATDSLTEALEWFAGIDVEQVVLKPLDGAGSVGVHFCRSAEDVRRAWQVLHCIPNVLGGSNSRLLIQERLSGWQYTVNSVSVPGRGGPQHVITEVWGDRRTRGQQLYDRLDLLDRHSGIAEQLAQYTGHVLDALGVVVGPAHTEIMYTAHGPALIEVGARLEGSYDPAAMRVATGTDHVRDTVTALATGRVLRPAVAPSNVVKVSLISTVDGTFSDLILDVLRLHTVVGFVGDLAPGRPVRATRDLITSPGRLLLAGDFDAIEADYLMIRALERRGLYDPAVHTTSCVR